MGLRERIPVPAVILENLQAHYQRAGVNVQLLPKNSEEAIAGKSVIKVEGRNIDLVHVTFASGSMHSSKGTSISLGIGKGKKTTKPTLRFHHIVKGLGNRTDKDLKTELKAEKKGMIKRKLVDVRWEGALAEKLNSDTELKKMLMQSETDNVKIEPDKKNDCIRITLQKGIDLISESKGRIIRKTEMRTENLPTMVAFDAMDIIAGHLKPATG
jgi:hypothetical protein